MRPAIYVAAAIGLAAIAPDTMRTILAGAASVVFESLPYLVAGAALRPLAGRWAPRLLAFAGCGCGAGPAARSIPAAVATAALFGPWVAGARWVAATIVGFRSSEKGEPATIGAEVVALMPAAVASGALAAAAPALHLAVLPPAVQFSAGAAAGLLGGSCALGTVAVAASLHTTASAVAAGFLCTAGIIAPFALHRHGGDGADRVGYALIALAAVMVVAGHGAALVHPRLVPALLIAALAVGIAGCRARDRSPAMRIAGLALCTAAIIGAPAPAYTASETTLEGLFPGEHLTFTGAYLESRAQPTVVRYAITCCRADARPVAIALTKPIRTRAAHAWVRVEGVVVRERGALCLRAERATTIAPPTDPFTYD